MTADESPGVFLITGCQRSGTTLMAAALSAHPSIDIRDEPGSYEHLARDATPPSGEAVALGCKVPRWSDLLLDAVVVDADQPRRLRWRYRGQPVVYLVRDPADVVASMLSLRVGGAWWADRYLLPLLAARLERHGLPTSDRDVADLLPRLPRARASTPVTRLLAAVRRAPRRPPLERPGSGFVVAASLYWVLKNQAVATYRARSLPLTLVTYEQLVESPSTSLARVLDDLALAWDGAVLEHQHAATLETDAAGLAVGNTDPRRGIDQSSVGRAAEVLRDGDLALVRRICEPTWDRLLGEASP